MSNTNVKYCALTTISNSLKAFVLPSLDNLKEKGYEITVSCAEDKEFAKMMEGRFSYFPLDISRGFCLSKTLKNIYVLWRFFKKEKFDMIEYGTENIAFCASIAGFLAHVPIRIYNHWGARYVGLTGIERTVSIWIERLAAFFSTNVRQVSHRNAEMCVQERVYPKQKVKVLGKGGTIGVDFARFDLLKKQQYAVEIREQYNLSTEDFVFGFVGRIQTDKGINELISAFRRIYESDKNVYLMLVGSLDTENPIEEENLLWAKECPNVIWTGFVSDTYKYISSFDLLVHPTYREGFGMVLQEAAAVKTPIITTNIMGPGEFIEHHVTGVLVSPKSDMELYEAMMEVMHSEDKRNEYAKNCYEYTRLYFERSVMLNRIYEDREELRRR